MEKTATNRTLADCHPEPFKGSKVAGFQVYLVALFLVVAVAVAFNAILAQ